MTSKILAFVLLLSVASCQQDEDDGSYNPEKYEKPYENLVDEGSVPAEQSNQVPAAFQQQPQQFQPQQAQSFSVQPQQAAFLQQQQNLPVQQPSVQAQNPFAQNPFFQQLQNPTFRQQQQLAFQQQNSVPQNTPTFQQQSLPAFQPQQFQVSPTFRQAAPVNQLVDDGVPLKSTNYQTNDGHQRSEVVDNDGNVLGQYSYVDPNGKTITVRYSAGRDGFKVVGDHIPKAPQPQVPSQPQVQPQPQFDQSQFNQPQFNIPQDLSNTQPIQFRPQQARFNNPLPQQFFSPAQARSQFTSLRAQSQPNPQQTFNPQSFQFNQQQTPFSLQNDGGYEVQSNFQ